jgi:GT2 family glycosyltransferase
MFFERFGGRTRVHMAGAANHVLELGDRRWLHEASIRELPRSPQAYQTENVDFHCVLVRRDALEALGPFDEKLVSLRDHADLCLAVRDGGGTIYVEPSAEATYAPPHRIGRADRAFWLVRWSDAANKASLERFQTKWHLSDDDPSVDTNLVWGRSQRQYCYRPWTSIAQRLSDRLATRLVDRLDPFMERVAVAREAGRASEAGAPRVIHRASWIASVESDACL